MVAFLLNFLMDELALIPGEPVVSGLARAVERASVFILTITAHRIKITGMVN